tara:strand:- start:295 stop:558 length:264 start_codon:yes stop_codon:yes gene_type:complete
MNNFNIEGFRDDVVEIVARVILHKDEQQKGIAKPDTNKWSELYQGNRANQEITYNPATIEYNRFRNEVDGTVAKILNSVYRQQGNHK